MADEFNPLPNHQTMSAEEVFKLVLQSPGEYRLLRGSSVGVDGTGINSGNFVQHLTNIETLKERIDAAREAKCFIEVISIHLQIIDYWLRIWFVNTALPNTKRRSAFGGLLEQCRDLRLPEDLYNDLKTFNRSRINAIHGYIVGATSYEALQPITEISDQLSRDTIVTVASTAGELVVSREQLTEKFGAGTQIIHVASFCFKIANQAF